MILYCIRFSKASLPFGKKKTLDVDATVSDVAHWTLFYRLQSSYM